jgi:hypothetical protein
MGEIPQSKWVLRMSGRARSGLASWCAITGIIVSVIGLFWMNGTVGFVWGGSSVSRLWNGLGLVVLIIAALNFALSLLVLNYDKLRGFLGFIGSGLALATTLLAPRGPA